MEQDFLLSLLMIIGIDLVLGADNAVVIALACRNLPVLQRNKAIILGTMLAIVFRIFITLIAVYLLKIPFLQLVGGVFLLYIAYNLIAGKEDDTSKIKSHPSLWRAIKTIVIADLLMGFDNVLAVAGAAQGHMVLVAMGLFISIPIIIWGSKIILVLLTKYPFLVYIGGGLLAFTSGKMIVEEPKLQGIFYSHPMLEMSIPYITASFIILAGVLYHQMINFQTARRD
ncbi:TerC family protein [Metabacillus sp. B2-18]|uniref:TerC family protein n=1 Tax=Metabacillus sp. B2-18 TaxID=2897333 RepID=UPI001E652FD1|nr:TerC family protein [Metabacillus sp. B2-18]UGB31807.1 TerC family protein [Metabacillus sp. B2-18]